MSNAFKIQLAGGLELSTRLEKASDMIKTEIDAKRKDGAQAIAAEAKQRAPVNFGILRNLITVQNLPNDSVITSGADYSAYVEFGTGTKVSVPEDLQEFAIQFKGTHEVPGMRAQPFFFPSVKRIEPILINDIQKTIDKI